MIYRTNQTQLDDGRLYASHRRTSRRTAAFRTHPRSSFSARAWCCQRQCQPQYEEDVLEAVFGNAESLRDEASQDSLVALVALPGYFVAVALISRMGPRRVQVMYFRW